MQKSICVIFSLGFCVSFFVSWGFFFIHFITSVDDISSKVHTFQQDSSSGIFVKEKITNLLPQLIWRWCIRKVLCSPLILFAKWRVLTAEHSINKLTFAYIHLNVTHVIFLV